MSADALQGLVVRRAATAEAGCPTLADRRITPHSLRHTAATDPLRRSVDVTVIALCQGQESIETTQIYLHADIRRKERALAQADPSGAMPERFGRPDELLSCLSSL